MSAMNHARCACLLVLLVEDANIPPDIALPPGRGLLRLLGDERMSMDVVCPGIVFPGRAVEGVDRWSDLHIGESHFLQDPLPACARQATGNSAGPEIYVPESVR